MNDGNDERCGRRVDVADLQEALRRPLNRGVILQDDEGARREFAAARASAPRRSTKVRLAIRASSFKRLIPAVRIGEVDECTAATLNDDLAALGTLDDSRKF